MAGRMPNGTSERRIHANTERYIRRQVQRYELQEARREHVRALLAWDQDKSLANEAVLTAAIERLNRAKRDEEDH